MGKALKIGIVDDNKAFRDSLRFFTESILKHQVISEAHDGQHYLSMAFDHIPDIVLMDIEMPGVNGMETTRQLLQQNFPAKIIAVTNHTEKYLIKELIAIGFKGTVFKNNIHADLPEALDKVEKGQLFFPARYF